MLHYGFCSNFCNPNSGHEKGHIENKVGYNRRNFLVPIPEFDDIREFNLELYSSTPNMAQKQLWIKTGAHEVILMDQNYNLIIRHQRLYGEKKESMKWPPYLELMAKRPTALKYTGFFKELPTTLQDYLSKCEYEQKKVVLKLLAKMVKEKDLTFAAVVFEETILKGVNDPDSIWATYIRLNSSPIDVGELILPDKIPELNKYSIDTSVYDTLLKGWCS